MERCSHAVQRLGEAAESNPWSPSLDAVVSLHIDMHNYRSAQRKPRYFFLGIYFLNPACIPATRETFFFHPRKYPRNRRNFYISTPHISPQQLCIFFLQASPQQLPFIFLPARIPATKRLTLSLRPWRRIAGSR